jgi:hypothetical protein
MQSFHEHPKVSLRLTVDYRVPSLNVTKRRTSSMLAIAERLSI